MTEVNYSTDVSQSWASENFRSRFARKLLFRLLAELKQGQLTFSEADSRLTFGNGEHGLAAEIIVHSPAFYSRSLFGGTIGAAESFIDGDWQTDNLTNLIRIMARNQQLLRQLEKRLALFTAPVQKVRHLLRSNSRSGSKKNILAHYDLGNAMYQTFLDPTMMYSSAIYPSAEASLEEASLYKLDHICRKLQLGPADHVIEIGSGWGGFAIHAASHYGCRVTTTTISDAQYEEAQKRIEQAGLSERITLLKQDYRDLEGQFDKLVSIEMIEAVGYRYLPDFFRQCQKLLKPDGMLLLQAITFIDQDYKRYLRGVDFIQRHIFPGGCLLSNQTLLDLLTRQTGMTLRSLEDFGFDYARTLSDWRERFKANCEELTRLGYDERFRRLWDFYFSYCEGGFLERTISVVQIMATGPENRCKTLRP